MKRVVCVAIFAVLVLAACNGGQAGQETPNPTATPATTATPTPTPTPTPKPSPTPTPTPTFTVTPMISDYQVNASSDDAYQEETIGTMAVAALLVDSESGPTIRYWDGFRFHDRSLPPKGSTILAAYLRFYPYYPGFDDINVDIYAEDAQSPPTFTTDAYNISDRTLTSASVPWGADGLGIGWSNSPSLVTVIQELVGSYDPTAIVLILKPRADIWKGLDLRCWDYGDHTLAAIMHIEWIPPTGGGHIAQGWPK
jgi:hypothetical protein